MASRASLRLEEACTRDRILSGGEEDLGERNSESADAYAGDRNEYRDLSHAYLLGWRELIRSKGSRDGARAEPADVRLLSGPITVDHSALTDRAGLPKGSSPPGIPVQVSSLME